MRKVEITRFDAFTINLLPRKAFGRRFYQMKKGAFAKNCRLSPRQIISSSSLEPRAGKALAGAS